MTEVSKYHPPVYEAEWKVLEKLAELGIDAKDIEFKTVMHPGKEVKKCLRYKYWRSLPIPAARVVEATLNANEFSDYDEDCGWLYSYDYTVGNEWKQKTTI